MDSMRTRVGKIGRKKSVSGSGTKDSQVTEREEFIYELYKFLDNHIVRCPSRQTGKVCYQLI
jgi:hypothetical protein